MISSNDYSVDNDMETVDLRKEGNLMNSFDEKVSGNTRRFSLSSSFLYGFVCCFVSFVFGLKISFRKHAHSMAFTTSQVVTSKDVTYTCPATETKRAKNDSEMQEFYNKINGDDKLDDLENYHTWIYDAWLHDYKSQKDLSRDWKIKHFASLKSGDTIYESACGMGLNLAMTLEILNEEHGIKNLVVYGNDYVEKSIEVANALFDNYAPAEAKKGMLCRADSTNLYFVPSNSFDMVYTVIQDT